jgi:WD40 repeat protein
MDGNWTITTSTEFTVQHDGWNCGPIACLVVLYILNGPEEGERFHFKNVENDYRPGHSKAHRIASASHDNTVRIWDSGTGVCTDELTEHSGHGSPFPPLSFNCEENNGSGHDLPISDDAVGVDVATQSRCGRQLCGLEGRRMWFFELARDRQTFDKLIEERLESRLTI